MDMENFVPYYYELNLGGHMACALIAAFVGGLALWLAMFLIENSAPFFKSFGFSLFASAILWVVPEALPLERNVAGLLVYSAMILVYPCIKYFFAQAWSLSAIFWSAYLFSQIALFFTIYYYLK